MHMETALSHQEAQDLFGALVDMEIPAPEEARLRSHLSRCVSCSQGWVRYEATVHQVRDLPRERAPMSLAGVIVRRERRRAFSRRMRLLQLQNRLPVELILPLLIAAAVVVLMALWAR